MTEDEKLSGCNSYVVCKTCGHTNYFINRKRQEPNSLEENYRHDLNEQYKREHETDEKTITCEKCGSPCSLC